MKEQSQHQTVTVSASSSPSEVISAIVGSANNSERSAPSGNRWLVVSFAFILVFAAIVYFREEIYTVTTDLHKHPILSVAETLQIRQNLGKEWHFEEGKDEELLGLQDTMANATAAVVAAVKKAL